jgi:hypothetical protein
MRGRRQQNEPEKDSSCEPHDSPVKPQEPCSGSLSNAKYTSFISGANLVDQGQAENAMPAMLFTPSRISVSVPSPHRTPFEHLANGRFGPE